MAEKVLSNYMEPKRTSLPFTLCSVGRSIKQPTIRRPHGELYHQFLWVTKGCGNFRMGNESFVLNEGEGVFTRAGCPCFYNGEDFYTEWCTFYCSDEFVNYVIGDRWYYVFKTPSYLRRETEELIKCAIGKSTTLELSALGYSYVVKLFGATLETEDDIVLKIKNYMQNNYHTIVSLDDLAEYVDMDKFALCKYYKQKCNSTIIDDLLKIRIGKAKRMLRYSGDSIENIGRACGFENPSYFCKKFREHTGDTPLQYRKKHI